MGPAALSTMATTESTHPTSGFCSRGMRNSKFLVLTGVLMIVAGIVTNTLVFFHVGYPMMAFGAFIVLLGLVRMRREKPAFMRDSSSPRLATHQMLHHETAQVDYAQDCVPEGSYPAGVFLPQHGECFPDRDLIPPPGGYPPPEYEATAEHHPSLTMEMSLPHGDLLPPSYDEATAVGDCQ